MLLNPKRIYSSIISLKRPKLCLEVVIRAETQSLSPYICRIIERFFSKTAKNVVKTIFQSPSPFIKIEFQGGDPSTDFEMVKYIIEEAEWQLDNRCNWNCNAV